MPSPSQMSPRRTNRLVGQYGHCSGLSSGRIVQIAQCLQRLKHSFIGVGKVQLVLAIVVEKKGVRRASSSLSTWSGDALLEASARRISIGAPLPTKPAITGSGSGSGQRG